MFIGHYGVSFAAKKSAPELPLWLLFLAVQWLDVMWAPLVLLGIEKVRIVPGFTKTNPLDLYFMPYTHSLVAAVLWSAGAFAIYRLLRGRVSQKAAVVLALAVFSHWVLDFIVHIPDLPLYDNTAKVGLGLWNRPVVALALEVGILFGGMYVYFGSAAGARRVPLIAFGTIMFAVQAVVFFGPPPAGGAAAAATALVAYALFALVARFLADGARATTLT